MAIKRNVKMEVFGEEYELSEQEAQEVAKWYEGVKEHEPEFEESKSFSPANLERALLEIGGNPNWRCNLKGKEKHLRFYEKVHPLGGTMTVPDAAKQVGVEERTGRRWLAELKSVNPQEYDLDKWPSKRQLDAYRLVHPEMGGLTQKEAAKLLGITQAAISLRLENVRKRFPNAFSFERMPDLSIESYDPELHDHQIKEKF